jgi:hypothetical protein
MAIVVEGEKVWNAKIDKNGYINKKFKGLEKREVYVVLVPTEAEGDDQA